LWNWWADNNSCKKYSSTNHSSRYAAAVLRKAYKKAKENNLIESITVKEMLMDRLTFDEKSLNKVK